MISAYYAPSLQCHAFRGIATLLFTLHNATTHAVAMSLVVAAGALAGISLAEWPLIALAVVVVSVRVAQVLNPSIESASVVR